MPARFKQSLFAVLVLALLARPAFAYIGPGAGFAAAGSLLVLAGTFAMALGIILIWPFKAAYRRMYPHDDPDSGAG